MLHHRPALAAALFLLPACVHPTYVPERSMPARPVADDSTQETLERHDGQAPYSGDPAASEPTASTGSDRAMRPGETTVAVRHGGDDSSRPVGEFCETILRHSTRRNSIACMPLASHDARSKNPWVSEYGVDLADEIAERLGFLGFDGQVLDTSTVGVRLERAEVQRPILTDLEAAVTHGKAVGADLIVFGTLRRDNSVGRVGRDVLTVDLTCWDFAADKMIARAKFEVPSDVKENARIWRLAQQESLWSPGRRTK